MSHFIQLHLLASYPPSNPNRDDLGRPKTAMMGGHNRLRISSQSLKRAWRTSDLFQSALSGHLGKRTKQMGEEAFNKLVGAGVAERDAVAWSRLIAGVFGALEPENRENPRAGTRLRQLAHFSPEEIAAIDGLVEILARERRAPSEDELKLLRKEHSAVDIALFGRMLADASAYNVEAAAQVAHAITVHRVAVEDDFFTAVDDLNLGEDDLGAAHLGETEFAAGLFYLYLCVDRELLADNLGGDGALVNKTLGSLTEAAATIAPSGKQASFGSRVYASYLLAERGDQQPRSLAVAYLRPTGGEDMLTAAIEQLTQTRANMDSVYGPCAEATRDMNTLTGQGSLRDIIAFVTE